MIDKFEMLPVEKQRNILNACYKVFALNGYKNASTNEIIKLAGISKGLLFHYFKTKQNLYIYLYTTAVETIKEMVYDHIDITEPDYLQRITKIAVYKLTLSGIYPEMFNFLSKAYFESIPECDDELQELNQHMLAEGFRVIQENIDFSLFREDLEIEKTIKAINAIIQDFSETINKVQVMQGKTSYDVEVLTKQIEEQMDFLKKCFYKKA